MNKAYATNLALSVQIDAPTFFQNLIDHTKAHAPFVVNAFFNYVKKDEELSCLWFNAVHKDCEESYNDLHSILLDMINDSLPANVAESIIYANNSYKTYCEVAQASMLEPHEEAAVWEFWEAQDEAAAYSERVELYRNEY